MRYQIVVSFETGNAYEAIHAFNNIDQNIMLQKHTTALYEIFDLTLQKAIVRKRKLLEARTH